MQCAQAPASVWGHAPQDQSQLDSRVLVWQAKGKHFKMIHTPSEKKFPTGEKKSLPSDIVGTNAIPNLRLAGQRPTGHWKSMLLRQIHDHSGIIGPDSLGLVQEC